MINIKKLALVAMFIASSGLFASTAFAKPDASTAPTTHFWSTEVIVPNVLTGLGSFTAGGNTFTFTNTAGLQVDYYNDNPGNNSAAAIAADIKSNNLFGLGTSPTLANVGLGDITGSSALITTTTAYKYMAVHVGGGELLFDWVTPIKSAFTITSSGGNLSNYRTYVSAVPEPETYAMLLAGLGLIGFMLRRGRTI